LDEGRDQAEGHQRLLHCGNSKKSLVPDQTAFDWAAASVEASNESEIGSKKNSFAQSDLAEILWLADSVLHAEQNLADHAANRLAIVTANSGWVFSMTNFSGVPSQFTWKPPRKLSSHQRASSEGSSSPFLIERIAHFKNIMISSEETSSLPLTRSPSSLNPF
jgi:hypothetical protein